MPTGSCRLWISENCAIRGPCRRTILPTKNPVAREYAPRGRRRIDSDIWKSRRRRHRAAPLQRAPNGLTAFAFEEVAQRGRFRHVGHDGGETLFELAAGAGDAAF